MDSSIINEATKAIRENFGEHKPEYGLILGTGLGDLAEEVEGSNPPVHIPYHSINNFPRSTVGGHKGQFVVGTLNGKSVIIMQGRFHYYEGYSMQQLILPIRVMKQLGVHTIIVTNAAGGVNTTFKPGDLMIMSDHINQMGSNPLIGPNLDEFGVRFPDMTSAYTPELRELAKKAASNIDLDVKEGVYVACHGPSFETPAEIRFYRCIGADAVGMSTAPEVIAASQMGMRVLGISCITNMASGITNKPLTHKETVETSDMVKESFIKWIKEILLLL